MIRYKVNTYLRKTLLVFYVLFTMACLYFYYNQKLNCTCGNNTGNRDLVAIFIAGTTLYFAFQNLSRDNDIFTKKLFTEFNERYDSMNEDLNQIETRSLEQEDKRSRKGTRDIAYDYLNLCAEEYYWYTKGHIPNLVWENWREGISDHLDKKAIKEIFKEELNSKKKGKSYYGFLQHMEAFVKE